MDDLISRQDAVNELREYITEFSLSDGESEIIGYNDGIELAISVLSTLSSAQQWIPCSERMPDEELYVLACQEETGFTEIGRLHTEKLGEDTVVVCQCDDRDEVRYIQAWMPLPKPYKGDDDG